MTPMRGQSIQNANISMTDNIDQDSDNNSGQMDINKQILDELKQLNGRIAKVEEKVEKQDKEQVKSLKSVTITTVIQRRRHRTMVT